MDCLSYFLSSCATYFSVDFKPFQILGPGGSRVAKKQSGKKRKKVNFIIVLLESHFALNLDVVLHKFQCCSILEEEFAACKVVVIGN